MNHVSRRRFLQYGAGTGVALLLPWTRSTSVSASAFHLEKFVEPLPVPGRGLVVAARSGRNTYSFTQVPLARRLHPALPPTPIWAYDDGSGLAGQAGSFGMLVVARTGTPVRVEFTNGLPATYPAWIPVDARLARFGSNVRVMTHLHGGFVAADSDGNPAATPDGFGAGETQTATYPNESPASLLWFHDHGPGTTRLNVFAGLAAAYIVRDYHDTGHEPNAIGIPGDAYEVPLVIQDRQINADGTLRYPLSAIDGVTWIGEYFGDVMLVNGKIWPFLDVEPRLYRFRILNGCNARILNLSMGGVTFWQIGGDAGLWDRPVPLRRLVLAPAERADVIVDFSDLAGSDVLLKNGRPPAPISTPAPPLNPVMNIRVGGTASQPGPRTIPSTLPGTAADLRNPVRTRYITLNEVAAESAAWRLNLNGAPFGFAAESPRTGTIEDWVYINLTQDTHPLHTHLIAHQIVGRTPLDACAYAERYGGPDGVPGGIDPTPFATGPMVPAEPEERGFKDTVKVNPGSFTTIRARFDLPIGVVAPQTYVHHCHILEHEDNDMMQPFTVMP